MIDFFEIPQVIARRIETANRRALRRLGEDIARVGSLNNYRDAQLVAIKMTGESVSAITRELSDASGMTEKDIEKLYADAARYDYEFAEQFYSAKDIEQIPFEENETLQRTVKALTRAAQYDCSNLSHSYAFALRDPDGRVRYTSLAAGYKEAIDKAITAVKLGTTDYKAEMRRILNQYADSGIRTVDWKSGYSQRLDTAVRRNIMDGLRQVKNETQKLIGEKFGADGYEISAHVNPAPDHADIQGRQYSFADFETLNDSLERRIGTLNCYHTVTAIILGISSPTYTEEELLEMKRRSEELIDIDGKKYTRYDCKQLQRKIETEIRKLKDRKAALKAAGDDVGVLKANRKIRMLREKYDMITQKAGLDPHYDRMSVPRTAKSIDFSEKKSIIKLESKAMFRKSSKNNIEPMPSKQFHRIEKSFKQKGGTFQYNDATDDYLKIRNAEAITYNATTILIKKKPSRASVFEELIHAHQYKIGKNDGTYPARLKCEIEAQKKLLSNQKSYKLTDAEVKQTQKALEAYEAEYEEYIKKGGN